MNWWSDELNKLTHHAIGSPFARLFPPWCLRVPSFSHTSAPTPLRGDLGKDVQLVDVSLAEVDRGYNLISYNFSILTYHLWTRVPPGTRRAYHLISGKLSWDHKMKY